MPSTSRMALLFPVGLLLVAMISIQAGAALAKGLFPEIGALGTSALRLTLGSLILVALLRPWRATLTRANLPALLAYGTALGCMNLLFYLSLQRLPLGVAVALEFTGPLVLAILSSRRLIDFGWIALAMAGLALLLPIGAASDAVDLLGACQALGAGACWALYIVFGQKAGAAHGPHTVVLGMLIAALIVLPIGVAHAGSALFSLALLPLALGVALLSAALPFSLEMMALTRLPTRTFSTLMSMEPAIAAMSGLLYLNEQLSLSQWLAILAIVLASLGTALTIKPRAR
ncbi:MAG: threonine/homoserine exporter RhtA [Pseudomonas sp.]|uniref:threonine/homoserine exporter RhtA n=1 Tax=Pseudomonas sp. TaxID=306 RepID=UPI00339A9912